MDSELAQPGLHCVPMGGDLYPVRSVYRRLGCVSIAGPQQIMRSPSVPQLGSPSALRHPKASLFVAGGIKHFEVPAVVSELRPPGEWPRLSIAPDQAGDGLGAYHFLTRGKTFNLDMVFDFSHGVNNDTWLCIEGLGLRGLVMQFLVAFNCPHGLWAEDTRYAQSLAALSEMFRSQRPCDSPLFVAMVNDMAKDREAQGHPATADPMKDIWQALQRDNPWSRKGSKLLRSRFMAFVREARKESAQFIARAFGYLFVCAELGWLPSVNPLPLHTARLGDSEPAQGSTASKVEAPEEKAMRTTGQNSMTMAAVTFSTKGHAQRLRIVIELCSPLEQWHSEQNKVLRSVAQSEDWWLQQVGGRFVSNLCSVVSLPG